MRKKLFFLGILVMSGVFGTIRMADAVEFEGSPDDNPNHFVWSLMSQMQTPDDPDCPALAAAALQGVIPQEEVSMVSTMACSGLASMRTNMQSGMNASEEESMETNLFDAEDWHNVTGLYFQHSTNGVADGRIAFSQPIDFMSYSFLNFMQHFGQNMDSRQGFISLDATSVGGFANYGASLTMYNVPNFDSPEILVNGEEDANGIVSNIVYDENADTITFSAAHFTSFEVVEADEQSDIDSVTYWKYYDQEKGKWMLKMVLKGRHFDKDTKVTLSNRKAARVSYKTKKKIVAWFNYDKLKESGRKEFTIRAITGSEEDKYGEKLILSKTKKTEQIL